MLQGTKITQLLPFFYGSNRLFKKSTELMKGNTVKSWDSSISIVTGYGLDDLGSIPGRARFFSSPQHPD
jgi:hypothetical protein